MPSTLPLSPNFLHFECELVGLPKPDIFVHATLGLELG